MTSADWVTLGEACALLQPHVGSINAHNLLADWRRKLPRYGGRIKNPPRHVKHCGRVYYPRREIARVIDDLRRSTLPVP